MVNSRNKGAAFERLICRELNAYAKERGIQEIARRNLTQYQQKSEADIYWMGFAIECKCYQGDKMLHQEKWWAQVCDAAGDQHIPLLIYKYNRNKPRFVLPAWTAIGQVLRHKNENHSIMIGYFEDLINDLDVILKNVYVSRS